MRIQGCLSYDTAFERPITPEPRDFDELGHVNNAVYLRWAQEIAIAHWGAAADADMKQRYLWVVLRHEIDYRDPVLPGDAVMARTWISASAEGPRFDRFVDIRKDGAGWPAASSPPGCCSTRRPDGRSGSEGIFLRRLARGSASTFLSSRSSALCRRSPSRD